MIIGRMADSFDRFWVKYDDLIRDPYADSYEIDTAAESVLVDEGETCLYSLVKLSNVIVKLDCADNVSHYIDYNNFTHPSNNKTKCGCRSFITPEKVTILMRETIAQSENATEADEKHGSPNKLSYRPLKAVQLFRPESHEFLHNNRRTVAILNALDWTVYGTLQLSVGIVKTIVTIAKYCFATLQASLMLITSPICFPMVMATDNLEGQRERFSWFFQTAQGALILAVAFPIIAIYVHVASPLQFLILAGFVGSAIFSCYILKDIFTKPQVTPLQIWNEDIPRTKPLPAFCYYTNENARDACEMVLARDAIARDMPIDDRLELTPQERIPLGLSPEGDLDGIPATILANRETFESNIKWHLPTIPDTTIILHQRDPDSL